MQSRDLYQYAILNVFQTLTLVKNVTTWYFPIFIITALNSAKRINKPITFTCRLRLWTCKAQFLQLGSILFDKALTAVFCRNTQRGNVLPSGTMGKYVRQNQHTICRLESSSKWRTTQWWWRLKEKVLVNRVIGQLFWDLGLSFCTCNSHSITERQARIVQ